MDDSRPKVLHDGLVIHVIPLELGPARCVCLRHGRDWPEGADRPAEGVDWRSGEACRECTASPPSDNTIDLLAPAIAIDSIEVLAKTGAEQNVLAVMSVRHPGSNRRYENGIRFSRQAWHHLDEAFRGPPPWLDQQPGLIQLTSPTSDQTRSDERRRLADLLCDHRMLLAESATDKVALLDLIAFLLRLDHTAP